MKRARINDVSGASCSSSSSSVPLADGGGALSDSLSTINSSSTASLFGQQQQMVAGSLVDVADNYRVLLTLRVSGIDASTHRSRFGFAPPGSDVGLILEASLETSSPETSPPPLVLRRVESHDDKLENVQTLVLALENEIKASLDESRRIEVNKQGLEREIIESAEEDGGDGERWANIHRYLQVMKQYNARVKELQALSSIDVAFQKTMSEELFSLLPHQTSVLPFLPGMVLMWCPAQPVVFTEPHKSQCVEDVCTVTRPVVEIQVDLGCAYPNVLDSCSQVWDMQVTKDYIFASVATSSHNVAVLDRRNHNRLRGVLHVRDPRGVAVVGNLTFIASAESLEVRAYITSHIDINSANFTYTTLRPSKEASAAFAPLGIAADATHVFVADTGNNCVQVFLHCGSHICSVGAPGGAREEEELLFPERVTVGEGVLAVVSRGDRISLFSSAFQAASKQFKFLRAFQYVDLTKRADLPEKKRSIYHFCRVTSISIANGMVHILVQLVLGGPTPCYLHKLCRLQLQVFMLADGALVRRCDIPCDLGNPMPAITLTNMPRNEGVAVTSLRFPEISSCPFGSGAAKDKDEESR